MARILPKLKVSSLPHLSLWIHYNTIVSITGVAQIVDIESISFLCSDLQIIFIVFLQTKHDKQLSYDELVSK